MALLPAGRPGALAAPSHAVDVPAQDFVFLFGGNGRVTYVDMNYRLTTQRARKGASRLSQSFPKPSRVQFRTPSGAHKLQLCRHTACLYNLIAADKFRLVASG